MWGILVVVVVIVLLIAWLTGLYNRLVTLRNRFKNAFSQIDVQLKRRYDLIPNLVETAKGYIKHERETLEAVVAARNRAVTAEQQASANPGNPEAMKGLQSAEAGLTGSLGRLFAVAEAYPDLKANQTMSQLMEELTSTENRVAFARQAYNDSVTEYNTARETMPTALLAAPMGFQEAHLWEIEAPQEREAVKVSFT
jgi:LemA protein